MTANLSPSQRSERVSPVPVTSAPTAPRRSASDQSGDRIIGVFAPELLHRPYLDPRMIEKVNGGYAQRDLDTPVHVSIGEPASNGEIAVGVSCLVGSVLFLMALSQGWLS
jgi:hypothetical protein